MLSIIYNNTTKEEKMFNVGTYYHQYKNDNLFKAN